LLQLIPKPTLEEFMRTCTPLAILGTFEATMQARVESIAAALLEFEQAADQSPVENLAGLLKANRDFLGVVLSIINLSQEKFLRILSADRFAQADYGNEWSIDRIHAKLRTESGFAQHIAQLFLDGRNSPLLAERVASFYLEQLSLPTKWHEIILDPQLVRKAIRQKLAGEYNDGKGDAIELAIRQQLDAVCDKYGVTHSKGQVQVVNKEVDHAIPSTQNAHVLMMSSYMETTSSSQTDRADKQAVMYSALKLAHGNFKNRVLVNFVDGAGWLARRSDLARMHQHCDYIVNLNTLDRLEAIICKHVPETYFTKSPRPEVQG